VQVTLQIVTATLGIEFEPTLRTEITRLVCCASRCVDGHELVVTATGNVPFGSFASWRAPDPQALSTEHAAIPAIVAQLLTLHPLKAS
jgi:hypothetical protein